MKNYKNHNRRNRFKSNNERNFHKNGNGQKLVQIFLLIQISKEEIQAEITKMLLN